MSTNRYRFKQKKLEKMNIRLLYISQAVYGEDWHSIKHMHHFTELFYVMRGHGDFIVEHNKIPVSQDDLIIINPNVSHTELADPSSNFEYIVLGIDGLQFLDKVGGVPNNYSIHNYEDYKHEILFYLRTLVLEVKDEDEYFEAICQNIIEITIMNMIRRTNKKLVIAPTPKISKECHFN